jgi:arginine decarboxylase
LPSQFKRLYDRDAPLSEALPRLVAEHAERYRGMSLVALADELQDAMCKSGMTELTEGMYAQLPEPVTAPATAYEQLVEGTIELVVDQLAGRVSAAMVVPYPPGIPVIMPGERFPHAGSALIRYLTTSQELDARFPAFETEIHGIDVQPDGSYRVPCLVDLAAPGARASRDYPETDHGEHRIATPPPLLRLTI